MARANTWTNPDGLIVGFGTHSDDNRIPAVTGQRDQVRIMTMTITGTEVEASASLTAASLFGQSAIIPRGSHILRARFEVVVPFTSGGAATMDIGTFKWDAIGTADDANGICEAMSIAELTSIGETFAGDGALIVGATVLAAGTVSDSDVAVVPGYGTAAYTAGVGILTVEYVIPTYGYTIAA